MAENEQPKRWKAYEISFFRFAFIFLIFQAIPLDWKYYRNFLSINWSHFSYADLFYIARYTPQIVSSNTSAGWGMQTLADWAILIVISVIAAFVWSAYDKKRQNFEHLYYLLRVILRYRLAIGVIAYGFIKVFPLQIPYPSLSLLNTNY